MFITDIIQRVESPERTYPKVGLLFESTGIPVFVIATMKQLPPVPVEIREAGRILKFFGDRPLHPMERLGLNSVLAFFAAGGTRLYLLPVTVSETCWKSGGQLTEELLGKDLGFFDRTGLHALKNYESIVDLVCFPQIAACLEPLACRDFYSRAITVVNQFSNLFLLVDSPFEMDEDAAIAWRQPLTSSSAAAFYPWISYADKGLIPASVVASAHLQITDLQYGLSESPANIPIKGPFHASTPLEPDQIKRLNRGRLNALFSNFQKTLMIWGSCTLHSGDDDLAHLQYARTARAIEDSIRRIAEPYLLEPRTQSTCTGLEEDVGSFFRQLIAQKILFETPGNGLPYEVTCTLGNSSEAGARGRWDQAIEMQIGIYLEKSSQRLGFEMAF